MAIPTIPNPRRLLVNCAHCGRDTRSQDSLCARCGGREHPCASREYRGRKTRPAPLEPLEDRYDEDSGPDDVAGGVE